MFVIVWEFQVKEEYLEEFETLYGQRGAWAELFQHGSGYLGTELFRDTDNHQHFITVDRWRSLGDYDAFLSNWNIEYEMLNAQCEGLTEQETLLGKWETISSQTR